jgi:hypothetical protein
MVSSSKIDKNKVTEGLQCPVDHVMINENKARTIAFFVLLFATAYLLTGYLWIIALLLTDFFLRVFNIGNYSFFGILADVVIGVFKIKNKPTDRAPKRFAAGVGLIFVSFILFAYLLQWYTAGIAAGSVLILFAALESFAGFCAGCYVYTLLHRFSGN